MRKNISIICARRLEELAMNKKYYFYRNSTIERIFKKEIGDDFCQKNDDDWDSLTHLDIVTKLEDEFGISFTPEEIGGITSLKEIVGVVEGKV